MVDEPNLPPPVIANDGASKPAAAEPLSAAVLFNANPEDVERDALTAADYAAAGVEQPDWANDPFPSMDTFRKWKANESKALAFKRANAPK